MEVSGQFEALAALTEETASNTHWIGGWVSPRVDLEAVEKRKIPFPSRETKPSRSARSSIKLKISIGIG
jgi:hypothetical protein